MLEGGILRRSMVLLLGNPGTGKTILSTVFLYHGASVGEKGIYVSLSEDREDYFRNMQQLGMDMKPLEDKGLFHFISFVTVDREALKKALDIVFDQAAKTGAKRLVIDSITSILQVLGEEDARIFLHSILGRLVNTLGITTTVIGELPYGESKTTFGVEEFVADGVIMLRNVREGVSQKRELEIVKMRGVPIERAVFEYIIDKKYGGIGLIMLPSKQKTEVAPTEKLSTGIDGLDRTLNGGVYRRSITLIEGAAGIGKTSLCLQFLVTNARKGERTLFISFEEPVGQIKRMLNNYEIDYEKLGDKFSIEAYVPEALTPLHYYKIIKDILDTYTPTVIAIDSLSAMKHTLSKIDFITFMRYLQLLCKEKELAVFLTSTYGTTEPLTISDVSTLADNIIIMRYYEVKDRLTKEFIIIKTRGSVHEKRVIPFEITGAGIVVNY